MRHRRIGRAGVVPALAFAVGLAGLAPPGGSASGQEPPAAEPCALRFTERYAGPKDQGRSPAAIGLYRVAFTQTIDIVTDKPGGAPVRESLVRKAIYAERPAEVSSFDASQVLSLVRRYESVRLTPDHRAKPSDPWPMDGLVIWFHEEPGALPKIRSLLPGRALRDQDYRFAAEQIAVPELAAILPYPLPVRVGDTYRVLKEGVAALVNGPVAGGSLQGKFVQIRDEPKINKRVAVLEISGKLVPAAGGGLALRAQAEFAFTPPTVAAGADPAPKADPEGKKEGLAIDVSGGLVKLSMAQTEVGDPGTPDRPRRTVKRQLLLNREFNPEIPPLDVPEGPPAETPENSWLTYAEPKGRFHFRHPQPFEIQENAPAGALILVSQPPEGEPSQVKLFFLEKFPKTPEEVFRQMFEGVRSAQRAGLVPGGNETLNWPGARALRRQAILQPGERDDVAGAAGAGATQLDGYVIQFPGGATLIVEATAPKDQAAASRKEAEAFLKTFQPGPLKK